MAAESSCVAPPTHARPADPISLPGVTDPADDAALLERLNADLDGVEVALGRLDTGEYGRCEVCGAEIEADRLEARPVEARCAAHRPV